MLQHLKRFVVLAFIFSQASWGDTCVALEKQYDQQDKLVTDASVSGLLDDSAPRETLRKLDVLIGVTRQLIILEFMDNRDCSFPKSVSRGYAPEAIVCATARVRSVDPPECDMTKWTGRKR